MSEALRRTPLYDTHKQLGARLVPFAGWEMPVQYSSISAEHAAVRERAGLFDVSHMGQLYLEGPHAVATTEALVTCEVASLRVGRARYGLMLNESAGCVDDVMVTRLADDALFLCVNASNIEKDEAWVRDHLLSETRLENRSDSTALLALQGPAAQQILARLLDDEAALPKRFRVAEMQVAGVPALVSATGYTGSPGFEIYTEASAAPELFDTLLEAGQPEGILPAGLGARDTLRLEAALALYGHELDDETTPIEAGLERFVKLEAGGFIGAERLADPDRSPRRLIGFEMVGRGIARADYPILVDGEVKGRVTSGAPSPTLEKSIGLGYVPAAHSEAGRKIEIQIRSRSVEARVVPLPFL